jgi:hypothetical protein
MMYKYIFVYIVLSLIIIKIIDFFSETFFLYFFPVHLNILDKAVSSLYANFGTPENILIEKLMFRSEIVANVHIY